MEYTADQVWGLAVRADTLNQGYVKFTLFDQETQLAVKTANKALVKQWLVENLQPTEEEIAKGREYRAYFKSYTLKLLKGKLNDFDSTALKIANTDVFTGRDLYMFSVVSCLPDSARRGKKNDDIKREIYFSEQLEGDVGDTVITDVEVVKCSYSVQYDKYFVQARAGDSYVTFFAKKAVQGQAKIKGKIKEHRADKTTALNYVKIIS